MATGRTMLVSGKKRSCSPRHLDHLDAPLRSSCDSIHRRQKWNQSVQETYDLMVAQSQSNRPVLRRQFDRHFPLLGNDPWCLPDKKIIAGLAAGNSREPLLLGDEFTGLSGSSGSLILRSQNRQRDMRSCHR